jgi:two-component system phosphate regulon sensor histidine kinase PhoR
MKVRFSFQSRIFGACMVVVLCTLAFTAYFIQSSLREQLIPQTRETLFHELTLLREVFSDRWSNVGNLTEIDRMAEDLGAKLGLRVTVITPEGQVVGDSDIAPEDLTLTENHSQRPEVLQALAEGRGWYVRRSVTLGVDLMYVATLLGDRARPGLILRLAMPLSILEENRVRMKNLVLWASLLGVLLSLGVALVVAHQVSRPVKELTRTALDIASGDLTTRLRRYPNHEIGDLGQAFDRMADHLQAEIEEVTRARDRLEAILRGMVEGVLVTDGAGRVTVANRAVRELLELEVDPLGRTVSEIIRNADLIEAVQQVSEGALCATMEIRTLGSNARILQVEVAPLPQDGSRPGVVTVFSDITERKRTEEMRRDFVANVSHELRTPLSAIKGAVETLLDGALDNPKFSRRFTETIQRHTKRLESLVLDLLDLARLESKDKETTLEEIHIQGLVQTSLAAVAELATARGVGLEPQILPGTDKLKGDRRQLEQALINLLENGIKYTETGGKVTVKASKDGSQTRLEVIDTGIGITAEHLPRIFERFYRVDKNRSRELGGTGLGLAIVKHVAQAHGGRVEVKSFPGRGSTFVLIIPSRM